MIGGRLGREQLLDRDKAGEAVLKNGGKQA
jgi:hypothetical protein